MCGIFGLASTAQSPLGNDEFRAVVERMFILSESRGKEAAGMAARIDGAVEVFKAPIPGTRLIRDHRFKRVVGNAWSNLRQRGYSLVIGHSRLMTNGSLEDNRNNQPVVGDRAVGVHNGIIVNDDSLWREHTGLTRSSNLDSEIIFTLLSSYYRRDQDLGSALSSTFSDIEGAASIAAVISDLDQLVLGTNNGSLFVCMSADRSVCLFTSEKFIARQLIATRHLRDVFPHPEIDQVMPNTGVIVNLDDLTAQKLVLEVQRAARFRDPGEQAAGVEIRDLSAYEPVAPPREDPVQVRAAVQSHRQSFDTEWIESKLVRCRKCLLPHTFPYIEFDGQGICSYCHDYQPISAKEPEHLEQLLKPYRRNGTEADCIVALSGGRDSTYGLHYIKKELGLNPIAYTYDWGMVEDLARRNCSRICGKLGVEHIIVSADIAKKRNNIARNVKAWLKRPDLGMVPLFMAGDKQFYYYANRLMEQTGIDLFFFCAGNELERTDFKTGFVGIRGGSGKGILNSISINAKLRMAGYFAEQFLRNPSYLNASLLDSAHAFFSSYFMRHNFHYLYHYVDWDESEIMEVLRREYAWEDAADTTASWRIGDGTAAFYNLIYYSLAGFTEYDTFRSNQIREGMMTRQEGLELVQSENFPRFATVASYLDMIGLDYKPTTDRILSLPKLYA